MEEEIQRRKAITTIGGVYHESALRKNIESILKTLAKKRRDDKILNFLTKLKLVSAIKLKVYPEDLKQEFTYDQTDFECPLCYDKHKDFTNLLIHWIYHHRQFLFKLYLTETIHKTYMVEGLIQRKLNQIKKKNSQEKHSEYFLPNAEGLYDKVKRRLQKTFAKEVIAWNCRKKLNHRPIFADEDSDEEEEKPTYTQEDIKQQLKGRTFYHTKQMFRKVSEDSLFKESEEEISDSDIIQAEEEAIDAYDDIEDEDKKFFKLWNRYVHEQDDIRNDKKSMVAFTTSDYIQFVVTFIRKNQATIQKENLRNSLVMHLTTLHIYGLLTKDEIVRALLEYETIH